MAESTEKPPEFVEKTEELAKKVGTDETKVEPTTQKVDEDKELLGTAG